jgi:hypothetical protein
VELKVLADKRGNIEEAVIVTLSLAEVNLDAGLVCGFKEVLNEELLLLGEFIIRALVNEDGGLWALVTFN